jgi:hypothetical protein
MNKNKKIRLFAVALMTGAVALGTQSCSNDEGETGDVAVTGITVTPETKTLLVGATDTLKAEVFPAGATNKSVTWTSDDIAVATVDANGVVTAVATGTATITATSVANTEKKATCVITVSGSYSISLNADSLRIASGSTQTLVATIDPSDDSQTVSWSSSNNGVATVTADGAVTGVAAGTATITAELASGAKAECTVEVVDASSVPAVAQLVGWWTFEDEANLAKSTIGYDLVANGDFTSIEGPDDTNKGVAAGENAYYTILHNIGANGGGEYTNEYTLMMDIRGSQTGFDGWLSVFDAGFGAGGLLWIDEDGKIGYEAFGGYSTETLTPDTWHRVVIAAKLGESFKVYIDGTLAFTATQGTEVDGGLSLDTEAVYIGYDGVNYENAEDTRYPGPDFAEVRMWSVQLTAEQVATLGSLSPTLP